MSAEYMGGWHFGTNKTMCAYTPVEEAKLKPGLRIAFTRGVPGPWSQAARALFDVKGIDYLAVAQDLGEPNLALREWTGQDAAPVAMLDNERPRAHWSEIIMLAERLKASPALIPTDANQRLTMFGLCHEICAEDGFGWNTRALLFAALEKDGSPVSSLMRRKYAEEVSLDHARHRMNAVVKMLSKRLEDQRLEGSPYFVGRTLSAADIYWTTFSTLVSAISHPDCPMPDYYRALPIAACAELTEPLPANLIEHREQMLRTHFVLPMRF
jgi:glutathione S-transferase